jgi:hypothetical protein
MARVTMTWLKLKARVWSKVKVSWQEGRLNHNTLIIGLSI